MFLRALDLSAPAEQNNPVFQSNQEPAVCWSGQVQAGMAVCGLGLGTLKKQGGVVLWAWCFVREGKNAADPAFEVLGGLAVLLMHRYGPVVNGLELSLFGAEGGAAM